MITHSRKFHYFSSFYLFLLLCICATNSFADNKDKNNIPWYQIEVIILANLEKMGLTSETWPDSEALKADEVLELRHPEDPTQNTSRIPNFSPDSNMPTPFELLGSNQLQLVPLVRKFSNSKNYRPLLHIGWRQPTFDPQKAHPVYIFNGVDLPLREYIANNNPVSSTSQSGADSRFSQVAVGNYTFDSRQYGQLLPISETDVMIGPVFHYLSGTIKLGVSRYLHVEVDLNYRIPITKVEQVLVDEFGNPMENIGNTNIGFNSQGGIQQSQKTKTIRRQALQTFQLHETRRMRSKEIHYFDHPMYGVITRVVPYEVPKSEPDFDPASQAFTTGGGKQQKK